MLNSRPEPLDALGLLLTLVLMLAGGVACFSAKSCAERHGWIDRVEGRP